jgi:hypothetical protein
MIIIGLSGHRAVITGARSDGCRDVQAAKIRCDWEEFRNGRVEIRGPGIGGGAIRTEAARDVAIRKHFSAGARIAERENEQLVHLLTPRNSAYGVREVREIQFAGVAKAHRIPS